MFLLVQEKRAYNWLFFLEDFKQQQHETCGGDEDLWKKITFDSVPIISVG
jgi:hypothetical protein